MNKAEEIKDILRGNIPQNILEMNRVTFSKIKKLLDDSHLSLWSPGAKNGQVCNDIPGYIFGVPVVIVDDKCFRERYTFLDGESHAVDIRIEI